MPSYIFAQKFDDLATSTSKMFYPAGVTLSRKEKLSIIWLAANYDPEKYKKIVPHRECESANIVSVCYAIMNPSMPYALRLSAQLLLGTVRVYRTKTKMLLEMAEQMIVKLSSLISETNKRTYDMPVAMLRADAITIADTGMSIIDYSLEPVYYDPQMIMHMNEDDFITVNGSPLQSPIKVEKKGKSIVTPTKSPLVVANSKISFQEDLLSPSRPIQVPPEDEDFGLCGFGPAQDNFMADLNLIDIIDTVPAKSLKPKVLDFGDDDDLLPMLEPVLEDDENERDIAEIDKLSEGVSAAEAVDKKDGIGLPVIDDDDNVKKDKVILQDTVLPQSEIPSDTISRKRKAEDSEDEEKFQGKDAFGPLVDLDKLLKDAEAINEGIASGVEDAAVIGKLPEAFMIPIVVDADASGVVEELSKKIEEATKEIQEAPEEFQEAPKEIVEAPQEIVEAFREIEEDLDGVVEKDVPDGVELEVERVAAAKLATTMDNESVPMDWEVNIHTPADGIILKPLPTVPKKKRKLQVDNEIFIESKDMKSNFATPDKLLRIPVVAGSAFPTGKDMFSIPIKDTRLKVLKLWWDNNLTMWEDDLDIHPFDDIQPPSVAPTEATLDEPMEEDVVLETTTAHVQEEAPAHDELPMQVEVPMQEEAPVLEEAPAGEKAPTEEEVPAEVEKAVVEEEAPPRSPEISKQSQIDVITPASIDILRAGSASLKSFEQSGGSTVFLNQTPADESSSKSFEKSMDINLTDEAILMGPPASPRISGIGFIPQDVEVDLDQAPELEPVLELEETLEFIEDISDNPVLTNSYKTFQSTIFKSLKTSEKAVFQRLFPSSRTKKRDAALAFYLTLNMHKNGYVELEQSELFGDITIRKGRIS